MTSKPEQKTYRKCRMGMTYLTQGLWARTREANEPHNGKDQDVGSAHSIQAYNAVSFRERSICTEITDLFAAPGSVYKTRKALDHTY